jgi:DNA-binding response OmpR family regulator
MSVQTSILVADDDPGVLDVVAFMLRREGFAVDEEKDGTAALEAARARPYDIVILDVMLPGVSGTEVCRELRAESDVPILMLTARDAESDRVHLTLSEFKVLSLLAEQPDNVVSRRELMQHLWASEHVGDEHACEVHISNLRRKIERDPSQPVRLVTVRGLGYKLVPA